MRISEEDLRRIYGKPPKKAKYNNKKPEYYDPALKETIKFDSEKERDYYLILKDRAKKGELKDIRRQVTIEIQPAFTAVTGERIQAINYKADFVYYDLKDGREHIVDVKGFKTEIYKLKYKLLLYKGIVIEEV